VGEAAPTAGLVPTLVAGTRLESRALADGSTRHRLFNPWHATFAILNDAGRSAVAAVNGVRTVEEIARTLRGDPGAPAPPETVERVGRFFDALVRQKLLYWSHLGPPPALETVAVDRLEEVWLNLTNRCNLRCITCFKDAGEAYAAEMSTGELLRLVDQLAELVTGRVILSGGEPLLRPDLPELLRALAERELPIFLITNGTLLDDAWADRLAALPSLVVQVSLDGSRPEINDRIRGRGSFERAVAAARRLADRGVDVRIYPTVTRLNLDDLPGLERLFASIRRDARRFAFARFHPTGRGARHLDELYVPPEEFLERVAAMPLSLLPRRRSGRRPLEDLVPRRVIYGVRKVNCGLGSGTLSVDADGTVYPCHWLHDERFAAGNVRTAALADIYFTSPALRACRELRVDSRIAACSGCEARYLCGGGCRARALAFTGDIAGADPECPLLRASFERGLWCLPMWEVEAGDESPEEVPRCDA